MMKSKNARIAVLSLVGKAVRLLAAPITLLIISKQLSTEELAFYYTFFSLIAMQQLTELGIGHVMKQYISHAYKDENGWTQQSKREVKNYYRLSKVWFVGVSVFMLFGVGFIGYQYLNLSNSVIEWIYPWLCLVVATSVSTQLITPQIVLEGTQQQEIVYKANLLSGLVGSISMWICLTFGLGLFSVSVSTVISTIVLMYCLLRSFRETKAELDNVDCTMGLRDTFKEVLKLLSRVSIVWVCGLSFLQSFNLISMQTLEINEAGKVLFCVALARAGYGVADSILKSQITIISNLIATGEVKRSLLIFKRYHLYSVLFLIIGYIGFLCIWSLFPNLYIFEKLPSITIAIQIFLYFVLVLFKTLKNDYLRCFKEEPFTKMAMFEGLSLPIVYTIASMNIPEYVFLICCILGLISVGWTYKIESKFMTTKGIK